MVSRLLCHSKNRSGIDPVYCKQKRNKEAKSVYTLRDRRTMYCLYFARTGTITQ